MRPRLFVLLFVAGLLVLGILAIACGDDGNDEDAINGESTVGDLTGTWRAIEPGSYVQFNADGTYRIALSAEDVENTTVEQGQFTLEGTLFTFISSDESRNCAAGQRGIYEVERTGEDGMRWVLQEDECSVRSQPIVNFERVP